MTSPRSLPGGLLAALLIGALQAALPSAATARQSMSDLHREGAVTGPVVESADAMKVTTIIQCFCGTCVHETLHGCTCGVAARERRLVAEALASGETPDAIIARYIAEHGPQVRIVPERRGLNLIGWAVPFVAALGGLTALGVVLAKWRKRDATTSAAPGGPIPETDRIYLERLERELKEYDR